MDGKGYGKVKDDERRISTPPLPTPLSSSFIIHSFVHISSLSSSFNFLLHSFSTPFFFPSVVYSIHSFILFIICRSSSSSSFPSFSAPSLFSLPFSSILLLLFLSPVSFMFCLFSLFSPSYYFAVFFLLSSIYISFPTFKFLP